MKKLMNLLFLSCLRATELIEKKLIFRLSLSEKIRLSMHKTMCSACTMYEKQSISLDKAISGSVNKDEIFVDLKKFKEDIISKIEQSDKQPGS